MLKGGLDGHKLDHSFHSRVVRQAATHPSFPFAEELGARRRTISALDPYRCAAHGSTSSMTSSSKQASPTKLAGGHDRRIIDWGGGHA